MSAAGGDPQGDEAVFWGEESHGGGEVRTQDFFLLISSARNH